MLFVTLFQTDSSSVAKVREFLTNIGPLWEQIKGFARSVWQFYFLEESYIVIKQYW